MGKEENVMDMKRISGVETNKTSTHTVILKPSEMVRREKEEVLASCVKEEERAIAFPSQVLVSSLRWRWITKSFSTLLHQRDGGASTVWRITEWFWASGQRALVLGRTMCGALHRVS